METRQRISRLRFRAAWALLLLLGAAPEARAAGETLTIGFTKPAAAADHTRAQDPLSIFVRQAVTASLTVKTGTSFRLGLADRMHSDHEAARWSFRIAPGRLFQNGKPIGLDDVSFSLDRCRSRGVLSPALQSVYREEQRPPERYKWIELSFPPEVPPEQRRDLGLRLAECPIFERRSALLFGDDFGKGSNLVSAGPYVITSFKNNGEFRFSRTAAYGGTEQNSTLETRPFADSAQRLTALRVGTIAALFTSDQTVLSKAAQDETLEVTTCMEHSLVRRRALVFPCTPDLDVTGIRYTLGS